MITYTYIYCIILWSSYLKLVFYKLSHKCFLYVLISRKSKTLHIIYMKNICERMNWNLLFKLFLCSLFIKKSWIVTVYTNLGFLKSRLSVTLRLCITIIMKYKINNYCSLSWSNTKKQCFTLASLIESSHCRFLLLQVTFSYLQTLTWNIIDRFKQITCKFK